MFVSLANRYERRGSVAGADLHRRVHPQCHEPGPASPRRTWNCEGRSFSSVGRFRASCAAFASVRCRIRRMGLGFKPTWFALGLARKAARESTGRHNKA
jgi:hypothetical protein